MQEAKFRKWMLKQTADGLTVADHGWGTHVAEKLGLSQPYVSRVINKKVQGIHRSETLAKIEDALGKLIDELLEEIEEEQENVATTVAIDRKLYEEWDALFKRNSRRGRKVLMNLKHQEELGYTDAISRIVRHVVELGPDEALRPVMLELDKMAKRNDVQPSLRRKLAKEFRKL